MVFSSNIFLFFFLPAVLLLYYASPTVRIKNGVLLIASLLFYFWGEGDRIWIMLLSCLGNFAFGLWIDRAVNKVRILGLGVLFNLGLLAVFKYSNFFVDNANRVLSENAAIPWENIALPIGISFFTFQGLSYLIDLSRGEVKVQRNPFKLSLYISLFPQLVAGPIVRYFDISRDLTQRTHSIELFNSGVKRFILGLSKKVLIANTLAFYVDEVMSLPSGDISTTTAWLGILAYSMQIYFDFSGYSDMAIGLGRMFGFRFLENFNFPYISANIQEFWRRWHISLSTWFRDYLYIPLGGNRLGLKRTYVNLIAVFFLTGFWHGASWNFIVWGLFHGTFLIVERNGLIGWMQRVPFLSNAYTLLVVVLAWVFFRVEGLQEAVSYILNLFGINAGTGVVRRMNTEQLLALGVAIFFSLNGISLLKPLYKGVFQKNNLASEGLQTFTYSALLFMSIVYLAGSVYNPFIYYRF